LRLGDGAGGFSPPQVFNVLAADIRFVPGRFNRVNGVDLAVIESSNPNPIRLLYSHCGATGLSIFGRVNVPFPTVGVADVTLKMSGAQTLTTRTDVGGNYEFTDLPAGGSYTLNPERNGMTFTPATRQFSNLNRDETANFDARRLIVIASAASYSTGAIAPDSIATLFGADFATQARAATGMPLPIELGGTRARLCCLNPAVYLPLFFVSLTQLNFLVPSLVPPRTVQLVVTSPVPTEIELLSSSIQLERVAAGLFSLDATGRGLVTAVVYRIPVDGKQVFEPVARFDPMSNQFSAVPINVANPFKQIYLLLFGTGWRQRTALTEVVSTVDGRAFPVSFAGAQGELQGLDQINLRLNDSLRGRGEVNVGVTVEGKVSNTIKLQFK
jgi:uncharacterized protein (TIGR03437 family)